VLAALERAGGSLTHSIMLQRVSDTLGAGELGKVIASLEEQGMVRVEIVPSKRRIGAVTKMYRLMRSDD
jgi:hypothetical protein